MYCGTTAMMFVPQTEEVMTGTPATEPPLMEIDGKSGAPIAERRLLSTNALLGLISSTTPSSGIPAVTNELSSVAMSTRGLVVAGMPVTPLVIEAGFTLATAATAGSTNC